MVLKIKFGMVALVALLVGGVTPVWAQDAKAIVQQAVNSQIAADREDLSHWRYVETEMDRSKFVVVETETGALRRHIDTEGKPSSAATLAEDDANIQRFLHDSGMRQKQRQNGEHDDRDAIELLNLMPNAFLWKVETETRETTTLSYVPNPNFDPPDMEARVMGSMTGKLVVSNPIHRIRSFTGHLEKDVTIGWGLLARLKAGSNFDIERREVAPGHWQITETHVHIGGHALFFKTIGQQEDEVKAEFSEVPKGTTLDRAVGMLQGVSR
jgi:hypothetical protein